MSNYTKATNFATKDTLPTGDAGKIVKGTEIDNEFNAISSAISSKADTASPAFTGTPTAPTAAAGASTTQLATTSFVTDAVTDSLTATATLTNKTLTSPTINGGTITGITDLTVADGGTGASTLTANAVLIGNGTSPITGIAPSTDDNVLISNGTSWTSASIGSIAGFDKLFAADGYQKLPSGLIIQWGLEQSISPDATVTITLPIAFPSGFVYANIAVQDNTGGNEEMSTPFVIVTNNSTFQIKNTDGDTTINNYRWIAIGY